MIYLIINTVIINTSVRARVCVNVSPKIIPGYALGDIAELNACYYLAGFKNG